MERGHRSSSDIMEDYCDGEAFKSHPFFSPSKCHTNSALLWRVGGLQPYWNKGKDPQIRYSLLFLYMWGYINFAGAFYFTVGNLSPKYRSRLSSIYLVALLKTTYIGHYGMDSVLKPIVTDVKELVSILYTMPLDSRNSTTECIIIQHFKDDITFCTYQQYIYLSIHVGKRSWDDYIRRRKNCLRYNRSGVIRQLS